MRFDLIQDTLSLPGAAGIGLLILALAVLAARSWAAGATHGRSAIAMNRQVFFLMAGLGLFDGLALVLLPVLGLSFGRVEASWILITLVRQAVFGLVGLGVAIAGFLKIKANQRLAWHTLLIVQALILASEVQGLYHEPFRLGVTTLLAGPPLQFAGRPLRLLQISDLHIERTTPRERAVLAETTRLQPDIIVLTGDYVNLDFRDDLQTLADTRDLLSQLSAPLGVYAVTGTVDAPAAVHAIFDGLGNIHLLKDELVRLDLPDGSTLTIAGVANWGRDDPLAFERLAAQITKEENTLLLYHTPDLAPLASATGKIDLYLAGHTHGGQVRVPFYGAVVTYSAFGLTYQMGRYDLEEMTLYVSRGLGMEGFGMPRARFLCPPELVLVEFKAP